MLYQRLEQGREHHDEQLLEPLPNFNVSLTKDES